VSANAAPAASELRLAVTGMTCSTCERSLERAIGAVPGVLSVAADHRTGEVRLRFELPAADAAIREAVEDAGYDLVGGPDGVGPL
jgi:copper chaperone CopZ